VDGQHEHARRQPEARDRTYRFKSAAGHGKIGDNNGWPPVPRHFDRTRSIGGFANDPHFRLSLEERPQPGTDDPMIIREHDRYEIVLARDNADWSSHRGDDSFCLSRYVANGM
jgi:hypothetical protein